MSRKPKYNFRVRKKMIKVESIQNDCPELQTRDWPPVPEFTEFSTEMHQFLNGGTEIRRKILHRLHNNSEAHGKFIHQGLSTIYAYVYGYRDSPCYLRSDPFLEASLLGAKLVLEEEMIDSWLPLQPPPAITSQDEAVRYLREFLSTNAGVYHELFDFLRDEVTEEGMTEFLRLEVCRNEVVDDEVALLVCGLQGNMKKVMASNLSDECGNGALNRFHTYWLRRLIERQNDWDGLLQYRKRSKPWFSTITSNTFNCLLTRPGYKFRAYGCFLATEAWVEPHFERILDGLTRLNIDQDDIAVYFHAHKNIDPQHTQEILEALAHQTPELTPTEVSEVLLGAHLAVAGGIAQYQRILKHLRDASGKRAR
jgi:hypothetical protein